jgi:hypothetical protein
LLKQEEEESIRRSESEEGMLFNAVLEVLARDDYKEKNPSNGVASKDIIELVKLPRIKRLMSGLGFYEHRKEESDGESRRCTRRKWFIKDLDAWSSAVHRYVPFYFDEKGNKKWDVDLKDMSPDTIPEAMVEAHFQVKLNETNRTPPSLYNGSVESDGSGKCPNIPGLARNNDQNLTEPTKLTERGKRGCEPANGITGGEEYGKKI